MQPRRFDARAVLAAALVGSGLSLAMPAVLARPTIRQSFFNAYPGAATSRLSSLPSNGGHCGVCHYSFYGGGARNPYGRRLGAVLGGFANTDSGRQAAIRSIEAEDPDGDGYSSAEEINGVAYTNTPTFPGLSPANVDSTFNVPVLSELTPYLVPQPAIDTQSPVADLLTPDGGALSAGAPATITWSATDNVGVTAIDLYWRDGMDASWTAIVLSSANDGAHTWFVPNAPTSAAQVLLVAWDARGNTARDSSAVPFAITPSAGLVATTLRDFDLPGTQPLQVAPPAPSSDCLACHGGYDPANEPGRLFQGSMMAQAGRDPLFYACLAIAEQDAPSSGDLCLRCHAMTGWMAGRSQPTDGSQLQPGDRDGVSCDLCHRMVNPVYTAGVSPPEDAEVLAGLLPAHIPTSFADAQVVLDPQPRRRGPFSDAIAPHAVLASAFHRSSEFCGTCHDVSNPVFARTGPADYAPGPLDSPPASMHSNGVMPLERTYSEWLHSAFPDGVYAPEFAGNRADGTVRTCQDCHMPDASARGCSDPLAPVRADLPRHELTGGSAWMLGVIGSLYPDETDAAALAAGAERARALLAKAATLVLAVEAEGDSVRARVLVTNRSGHKLPTGYPEGRRMWLHVVAYDAAGSRVFESGAWDPATGTLAADASLRVYQAHLGISPSLAAALGLAAGPSFHFVLNDSIYLDNRIPPLGFTNAGYATFGGAPVDPAVAGTGPRYADGQNCDVVRYALPRTARSVTARLLYQSTSREYIEFLRDRNTRNDAGRLMYDAWVANGRAAPLEMVRDSLAFTPSRAGAWAAAGGWVVRGNPFGGALAFGVSLARTSRVSWSVFDAQGRTVRSGEERALAAGTHELAWDGRDRSGRDAGSGVFWLRVSVNGAASTRRVVRLR